MVRYIAHRGNIYGRNISRENDPEYIKEALALGYDVEIDVWVINNEIFLGHDEPQYKIDIEFLKNDKFWCHAKNFLALNMMYENKDTMHYFSHDLDNHVLTSRGIILALVGKEISNNTVCIMPERTEDVYTEEEFKNAYAICSDYVAYYKQKLNATTRIAMVLSGRATRYEFNLLHQLKKFYNKYPTVWIDIFVSINGKPDEYYMKLKADLFVCKIRFEEYIWPENFKQYAFTNVRHDALEDPRITYNMNSMYYNNLKNLEMIQYYCNRNNITYDKCILYRSDIVTEELPYILMDILDDNTVYFFKELKALVNNRIVTWRDEDKITNGVVLGTMNIMIKYLEFYKFIEEYIIKENILFHSETVISHYINKLKIKYGPFDIDYIFDPNRK
jgi:hypothetical protein